MLVLANARFPGLDTGIGMGMLVGRERGVEEVGVGPGEVGVARFGLQEVRGEETRVVILPPLAGPLEGVPGPCPGASPGPSSCPCPIPDTPPLLPPFTPFHRPTLSKTSPTP